jgi:hypothetical protein
MGNPVQSIPNLPPAISLSGSEQTWISQAGVDRRTTLAAIAKLANFAAFGVLLLETTVGVALQSIPPEVGVIVTSGYYLPGDGGGAPYIRAPAPGPGPGLIQTADGGWWVLADLRPNVRQFGAVGDGVTDDGPPVQLAVDFATGAVLPLFVPKGTYSLQTRQMSGTGIVGLCLIPTGADFTLIGDGYESVFTIPDGFSTELPGQAGDYSFFVSQDNLPHGNVEVSGIRIYGNGGANLVLPQSPPPPADPSLNINIRRGYGFRLAAGTSFYCHDCYFEQMGGRNVLLIVSTVVSPGWRTSRVVDNHFTDVGGAIAGNENQSDHSTIYIEAAYSLVMGNVGVNNNVAFNPFAVPQHPVTYIEEHSARAVVTSNTCQNWGTGSNGVAAAFDVIEQIWANNQFLGMKSNCVQPITFGAFKLHRFLFHNNVVELDNTGPAGGSGILQTPSAPVSIGYLSIIGNAIYCLRQTPPFAGAAAGVSVTAVDYLVVRNNEFAWFGSAGVFLTNNTIAGLTLGIEGGVIDGNRFHNCGMFQFPWSIFLLNGDGLTGTPPVNNTGPYTRRIANITIGPDNFIDVTPQPVGATPALLPTRGIAVQGPGILSNIRVHTPRTKYILRGQRVSILLVPTNDDTVVQVPRDISLPTAGAPTQGYFDIAGERVIHNDPTAATPSPTPGNPVGRIVQVAGSGFAATWAAATPYLLGQWIKTSINKVLICTVAGTSGAAEPNPATLGTQIADGTVTWFYTDAAVPTFAPYGNAPIKGSKVFDWPSLAAGAVQSTTVTAGSGANGAALGDVVQVSMSVALLGTILSGEVTAANTVTVYQRNPTAGAVDVPSGTLTVWTMHP